MHSCTFQTDGSQISTDMVLTPGQALKDQDTTELFNNVIQRLKLNAIGENI